MRLNMEAYVATAQAMVAGDKGLLAMDESTGTCNKRFGEIGVAQTLQMRPALDVWRGPLVPC